MESRVHVKRYIGIHYFFEGTGSSTTLTKKELDEHRKAMEAFLARQQEPQAQDSLVALETPPPAISK
jgi:hypothetical protein